MHTHLVKQLTFGALIAVRFKHRSKLVGRRVVQIVGCFSARAIEFDIETAETKVDLVDSITVVPFNDIVRVVSSAGLCGIFPSLAIVPRPSKDPLDLSGIIIRHFPLIIIERKTMVHDGLFRCQFAFQEIGVVMLMRQTLPDRELFGSVEAL